MLLCVPLVQPSVSSESSESLCGDSHVLTVLRWDLWERQMEEDCDTEAALACLRAMRASACFLERTCR